MYYIPHGYSTHFFSRNAHPLHPAHGPDFFLPANSQYVRHTTHPNTNMPMMITAICCIRFFFSYELLATSYECHAAS